MVWEPHTESCECELCELARRAYTDVWAGNPDTDKYWSKEN